MLAEPVAIANLDGIPAYWVYEPDPSGGQDCSGMPLTLMHDRAAAQP